MFSVPLSAFEALWQMNRVRDVYSADPKTPQSLPVRGTMIDWGGAGVDPRKWKREYTVPYGDNKSLSRDFKGLYGLSPLYTQYNADLDNRRFLNNYGMMFKRTVKRKKYKLNPYKRAKFVK